MKGAAVWEWITTLVYDEQVELERELLALHEAGDLRKAATLAIEEYGPEVLGFLLVTMRNEDHAREVFAQASCDLWTGLARFERRSSFRTWFYVLARHAAARFLRSPHVRPGRHVAISEASSIAERVRTRTLPHLQSEVKDQFARIRDALAPDDRALLVLRVDRNLDWNEVAQVLAPAGIDEPLPRVAARLRKRFQLVKEEIRRRAKEAGLLDRE